MNPKRSRDLVVSQTLASSSLVVHPIMNVKDTAQFSHYLGKTLSGIKTVYNDGPEPGRKMLTSESLVLVFTDGEELKLTTYSSGTLENTGFHIDK